MEMENNIIFYTYSSTLELNGQQFDAGRLTEELLNLSPADYRPMHERMARITELEHSYAENKQLAVWWELNEEMTALCQELRSWTVFRLLLDEDEDRYFSVVRQVTEQYDLFAGEEYNSSPEMTVKKLQSFVDDFFQQTEPRQGDFDLFDPYCGDEDMYYQMLLAVGATDETWNLYCAHIKRYRGFLHDIRAFVPTIRNFIKFILSKLKINSPETYAAALYDFYNDRRIAEKLIVNPIRYDGDCYRTHDRHMLSYVPRELPDGSVAICQEHVTDSLQALMKADYMLALNSGYNIRRCIICEKYFLLKSGVHALYCEGACPHAPGYTCRQFGTVEVQKELAKNIPKVKAKLTAFSRITKDMQRGSITQEEARKAKDYIRDLLYDALRDPNVSVERFTEQIDAERVYHFCQITRLSKQRGRPPKKKAGEAP